MPIATWNGTVIARSDETVVVEGNHYFPPSSVDDRYLEPTAQTSRCHWKGLAHYYDVVVDGQRNPGAAWVYPEPSEEAAAISGHFAFWKGVEVTA
jgi:uncharacterized protein (DUF427 family)